MVDTDGSTNEEQGYGEADCRQMLRPGRDGGSGLGLVMQIPAPLTRSITDAFGSPGLNATPVVRKSAAYNSRVQRTQL